MGAIQGCERELQINYNFFLCLTLRKMTCTFINLKKKSFSCLFAQVLFEKKENGNLIQYQVNLSLSFFFIFLTNYYRLIQIAKRTGKNDIAKAN